MSTLWSELVHRLDPYVPGEQPKVLDLIKLNTNENPYPPSPKALAVLKEGDHELLRLYPDPASQALKASLATHFSVEPSQVFVGNGSDEVLALSFMAFFKKDKPILFPDISYSFYPVYCGLYEIDFIRVPLAEDFSVVASDYAADNAGVIFPNPNAPTGKILPLEQVEAILQANRQSVVIVDEAYIDFGGDSAVALVARYDNLLVVQTLSKSRSLAGLRLGFAIGNASLIDGLERVKNSFNSYPIDRIAESVAIAAIEDVNYFEQCCAEIISTRTRVEQALQALNFDVLDSSANFLFAAPRTISAKKLFEALREKSILVRYFDKPRISGYLRISIGTNLEMDKFLQAVSDILSESSAID